MCKDRANSVRSMLPVIDAWLGSAHSYQSIPGLSVGIVQGQSLIWEKGYGALSQDSGRSVDADTIYSICSQSKLFTAIGIMQLRDRGQLSLQDTVVDHLPWFNIKQPFRESGPITIESLLTHSSGLPRESDFPYWSRPDFRFPTRDQLIEKINAQTTLYPVRRVAQYSNLGLSLAGEIIREVDGRSFENYIIEEILHPMKLSDTRPNYPVELRGDRLAIGYSGKRRDGTRKELDPFFSRSITSAAGFTSSVRDLARFIIWQFEKYNDGLNNDILKSNTLRDMHSVHWMDEDWNAAWGIGFEINRVEDMLLVGHSGGCPGYTSRLSMNPKNQIGVIVLTNVGDAPVENISTNIQKTLHNALKINAYDTEDNQVDLSKYEGNYESWPWGKEFAIRQVGGELVALELPTDNVTESLIKLRWQGDNRFVRVTVRGELREPWEFLLSDCGKVSELLVHSNYHKRIS